VRTDPYSHPPVLCAHFLCPLHMFFSVIFNHRPPPWLLSFLPHGSLASLRRLMGWQVPSLAYKVKSGDASLANMRSWWGWCRRCPPSSSCC
jgi:hypothetical protein